jgi:Protein of unknown function (DUF3352)
MRVGDRQGRRRGWRARGRGDRRGGRRLFAAPNVTTGLTIAVALTGALAGCGSSAPTGTSANPAGVAPATAAVYVGAVVRPQGSLETEALAAGHKLTNQPDPYTRLLGVLQTPGSPTLDFGHDVAPWLGPNAGLFFTSLGSSEALASLLEQGLTGGGSGAEWPFGAGGAQGAIVLDTSDLAKAKTFLANAAAHAGAHTISYRGVTFQAASGGDAFAIVDRFVVLGTEAGVHSVIDTVQGGASLQSDAGYAHLQSVAPAGALGHVYANPAALTGAHAGARESAGAGGGATSKGLPELLGVLGGVRPLNVSLVPSSSSLALDADVGPPATGSSGAASASGAQAAGTGGGLVAAVTAGSRALGELPGESWLAAGLGNAGGTPGGGLEGLHGLLTLASTLGGAAGGEGALSPGSSQTTLSVSGLIGGLLTPLNALGADTGQARRDFRSWMGETGVFASGTSVLELKAGVVIDSLNAAASHAAVAKLASALRAGGGEATPASIPGTDAAIEAKLTGLPVTLVIASGRGADGHAKFVMGLGEASIQDALSPSSTMSSASSYSAAQTALGEGIQPSITVDFGSLLGLLEGVGLSEDPAVSKFVPYLRASSTLAGGGKSLGGGIERLRLVVGLQPSAGG